MTEENNPPASAPCAMHELQDNVTATSKDDVRAWRNNERARLRKRRRSFGVEECLAADIAIGRQLDKVVAAAFPQLPGNRETLRVAVYWPLPGEPGLQEWYASAAGRGMRLLLPVVRARDESLVFRHWRPGDRLQPDILGIPSPFAGKDESVDVWPDIIVAPCVGFDERCYRLGNGGGYYDRTLAGDGDRPLLLGVAYEACALRSIYPQRYDVPMDAIVTEQQVRKR